MEFLQWTTKLPPLWEAKPLKAVASYSVSNVDKIPAEDELPVRLCNYTDVYKNEFISPEMDLMLTTATASEIAKFCLKNDDVIITKDSESWDDIAIPALVVNSADDLLCGYHLAILRPTQDVMIGRFLFRCLQSKAIRLQLELASTGVTRFGLPKDEIGKLLLPIPPLKAQYHIADYLDAETAQIDALVAEKEHMLALLEEKRAALISHAVTRGLDSGAPLKPSGLEWLGDIPAHWEIRRLGFLFILQGGCTPSKANDEFWKGEIAWASSKDIKQQILTDTEDHVSDEAMDKTGLSLIEPPVVLLVVRGMILAKRIPTSLTDIPVTINQDLKALKPDETWISPTYLKLLFDGLQAPLANLIEESAHGTKCFRTDLLTTFKVPLPPLPEQTEIIFLLSRERTRTAELEETLQRSIAILKERRSALITAAVTGQLQIPENQSSQ